MQQELQRRQPQLLLPLREQAPQTLQQQLATRPALRNLDPQHRRRRLQHWQRKLLEQMQQELQQQLENERSKSENEKDSLKQAALSKMEATIEQHTSEIRTLESQVY